MNAIRSKYLVAENFLGLAPNFLRDGQVEILEKFLDQKVIFLTAPTGWGKTSVAVFSVVLSIMTTEDSDNRVSSGQVNCAMRIRTEWKKRLCVIVSPHIALIHGHIKGIKRKYNLDSVHYTREAYDTSSKFIDAISESERLYFVLLCPETFVCVSKRSQLFHEDGDLMKERVAVIFIDEIQDFMTKSTYRPDLSLMCKSEFTTHDRKLILATGTPTFELREYCAETLFPQLKDKGSIFYSGDGPQSVAYSQDRPNVYYHVSVVEKIGFDTDFEFLLKWLTRLLEHHKLLPEKFPKTLIYMQDVDLCERLWSLLLSTDVYKRHYRSKVKRYYAVFLTDDGKRYFVEDLCETDGKVAICISTNALGKGIDIPDVRILVIIGGLPFMADVLQVFGRAGRDGNSSMAYLYVSRDFALDDKLGSKVKTFINLSREGCIRSNILLSYLHETEKLVATDSDFPCCSNCSVSDPKRCGDDVAYLLKSCLGIKCDRKWIRDSVPFMPKLFARLFGERESSPRAESVTDDAATKAVAKLAAAAQQTHYRSTAALPWLNENKEAFRSDMIEGTLLRVLQRHAGRGADVQAYFTEALSTDMVRLGPRLSSTRDDHVPLQQLLIKHNLFKLWRRSLTMLAECQDSLNEYRYDEAIVADEQAPAAPDESNERMQEMRRRDEEESKELSDVGSGLSEAEKKKKRDEERSLERSRIIAQTPVDETKSGVYVGSKWSSEKKSPYSVAMTVASPVGAQTVSSARRDLDSIRAQMEPQTPK